MSSSWCTVFTRLGGRRCSFNEKETCANKDARTKILSRAGMVWLALDNKGRAAAGGEHLTRRLVEIMVQRIAALSAASG